MLRWMMTPSRLIYTIKQMNFSHSFLFPKKELNIPSDEMIHKFVFMALFLGLAFFSMFSHGVGILSLHSLFMY